MNDLLEPILRDTFEKRAAQLSPDARRRLMAIDYHPRRRRIPVLPALGATGLAGAVAALVVIFTLGSSPAPAFAGWSPTPTLPRQGETAAAIARCHMGRPVLIDTRGPFTAAVYANPKPLKVPGLPRQTSSPPIPPVKRSVGACLIGPGVDTSGSASSGLAPVHSGQIQVTAQTVSGGNQNATVLDGRVGAGVTGVRIRLSNGRTVTATVRHGWYLAWWPGNPSAARAEITTDAGTQAFRIPAADSGGPCGGAPGTGCASFGPVLTIGG